MFLIGDENQAFYSPDGYSWSPRPGIPFPTPTTGSELSPSLTHFNGRWVARKDGGVALSNPDGSSWQTVLSFEDPFSFYSGFSVTPVHIYTYEDDVGGANFYRSPDGFNWENFGKSPPGGTPRFLQPWWFRVEQMPPPFSGAEVEFRDSPTDEEPAFTRGPYAENVSLDYTGRRLATRAGGAQGGIYQVNPGSDLFASRSEWPSFSSLVENSVAAVGRVSAIPGELMRSEVSPGFGFWEPVTGPPPNNVELFGNKFVIHETGALWFSNDGISWERHATPAGYSALSTGYRRWPIYFLRNPAGHLISTVDGKSWQSVGNVSASAYVLNSAWNGVNPAIRGGGFWPYRQRQSFGASGYPYRQRQNGGNTGSHPYRQRQRGL